MTDRPNAADVLADYLADFMAAQRVPPSTVYMDGSHDPTAVEREKARRYVRQNRLSLLAAVTDDSDAIVCLLPDGTLSVAVTALVLPQDLTRPDPPLLFRIRGADK